MNEITLIIIVVIILLGLQLLTNNIKRPKLDYVNIIGAVCLLILIWFFGEGSNIPVRVILTILALGSIYKAYVSLKKYNSSK